MNEEIKTNITSPGAWLRLLIMIGFGIVVNVLIWLVWVIAAAQFICSLITAKTNENLDDFSAGLVAYITRIFEYLVYRTDTKPFPFSSWDEMIADAPEAAATAEPRSKAPRKTRAKKEETEEEA